MATAEEQPRRGGAGRVTLSEGQRFCITGMSLADPAATAGQPPVTVLAEVGHETHTIGTLSSEEPIKPVLPPVELDDGEFVLRHDSAASSVRLYGYYLDPPEQDGEGEPTRRRFFVDIDAEELGGEEEEDEYETGAVEDLQVRYDSDCSEDESDDGDSDEEEEEEEEEEGDETSESSDVEAAGEISKRRKISTEDSL